MKNPISNLTVLALAAGLLVAAPLPASAANGRIVFVGGRGGAEPGLSEIWSVLPGGGAAENLTKSADAVDVDPSWDPTSSRIVFSRQEKNSETFDLFTMNADGTSKSKIKIPGAANNRQPDWSSTGPIAFVRSLRAQDTSNIFTVNEDGSGLGQLTDTHAPGYDAAPAWSPSGAQIAFVSDRSGSPQLYIMDASGVTETQLTFDPCWASNPSWSPDATQIVYERQCPDAGADIYTVGTTAPATPAPLVVEASNDHQPSYSPDGDLIAFTRVQPNGDKDLFTVPTAGGPATALASNSLNLDMSADWGSNVTPRQTVSLAAPARGSDQDRDAIRAPGDKKKKKKKREPKRFKVVPGVRYSRFRRQGSTVHLLKVNTDGPVTLDAALSNDRLLGHETTSHMAKRHGAVAAINGDFGLPSTGRTAHTFAEDGDLKQLSFAVAWNFAITRDEKQTFFARPQETVTAEEDDAWRIERWNFGEPRATDIAAFTPAGRGLEDPPANACYARLMPAAGPRWTAEMAGVETPYTVDSVGCSSVLPAASGGVVLAAQPGSDGAILLSSLNPGEAIDIGWTLGWAGVADSVGGTPLLVEESKIVAEECPEALCRRNPRTVVGVNAQGRILLVVVEGRTDDSHGATLVELAQIMRGMKATYALNLDGGGSSTMVVNGKLMNEPSDGKERKVSSSILVLNGPDAEEVLGDAQPSQAAPALGGFGVSRAALLDPGSTGGLLEAMAAGTFGPPVRLPAELRRALRAFRAAG